MQAVIERHSSPARFAVTLAAALLLGGAGGYIIGTSIAPHATSPGAHFTVVGPVQGHGQVDLSTFSGPTEPQPIDGLTP